MTTFIGKYLNPGEMESLLKIERDKRRKKRLNQVRQQAREKASQIMLSVKKERDRQLQDLSNHLKAEWLKSKRVRIEELGHLYGTNLASVGAAHSDTYKDIIAKEVHAKQAEEDNLKSAARGATALNEARIKQFKEAENAINQDTLRKAVRTVENERAQQIAALPPPPPPPLPPPVTQKDKTELSIGGKHSQTHSVQSSIQRAPPQSDGLDMVKVIKIPATDELDARLAAKLDEAKQAEVTQKKMQEKIEQTKKERVRFLKAKSKLELQQDYNIIMNKLEELIKQEEVCSEPHLLYGMEKENSMLKQVQEAIVEELFSRLGLSLADSAIAVDATIASYVDGEDETDVRSTNFESTTHESASDNTPVVHVIVHDSSSSVSHATDSSPEVQTRESSSLESGFAISNDIYASSYPIESTTSISASSIKASEWSGMTPVNANSKTLPTSGSTITTSNETILAGHFCDRAFDSSEDIPVLPSLDSSDSEVTPETSQLLPSEHQPSTAEKRLINMDFIERAKKSQHNSFELHPQEISLNEGGESKRKYESDKSSATWGKQQMMQTLSSFERDDASKHSTDDMTHLQNRKLNIMDGKLRRLALTNLLASKKLGTSKDGVKSQDFQTHNKFCNVEIRQTNRNVTQNLANQSSIETSPRTSVALDKSNLHKPSSHLPAKSEHTSQESKNLIDSVLNTPLASAFRFTKPSISGVQMDAGSLRFNASGLGLTPDTFSPSQFSFRPNLGKLHLGKMEPFRDLSTIVEMDTPGSSQHTCWQNSSTLSISKELESGERFGLGYGMNEPGITDEPDLTLVGSECSTCSPNQSHVFDTTGITPSMDSFINTLESKSISECSIEVQNGQEIKRYKRSAILTNAKRINRSEKIAGSDRILTVGGHLLPLQQELSYFLRDVSSGASPSLDSYSTSVDSSGKKDWSTPTLSSSESHSCFSSKLQKLPILSTPNFEFPSGSNPPSFFTQNSNPSEIKSEVPSNSEELVSSDLSQPYFTSALDSTMENCTDSLLSFIVHERNADLAHLSTLDTVCTDVHTLSGESPLNSEASNGKDASLALRPRFPSSQSESISDSMFSFLRHELSANDSNFSGIGDSPSLDRIS